ncbi:MAG TPA: type II secretion system F family protein [Aquabacterium sp.]|uniref:type II secretion system F family protein n=1 Tax=Aquabacterium sp. TaxID=1872578 RepID=UPI002E3011CD|nr:type II secretion system F family protein [Aquabacterium sp.]HEX5373588.1 type II secretion system F family protein [Aquabacterium sp.]
MSTERYSVRHLALGRIAEHEVQATSAREAVTALAALLQRPVGPADVLSIRVVSSVAGGATVQPASIPSTRRRQTRFPQRLFCQELAVLLDAGIPLLESIQTLREKESAADVAHVLSDLIESLTHGQSLAQAMRGRPEAFSTLLVASVEASARTGQTAQALRQQAAYLAWVEGMRHKLISAAIYPAILVSASVLVMAFLTIFVVPRFAEIYEGMGGDLPWLSGLLLRAGAAVGAHPWQVLGGLIAGVVALALMGRQPAVRAALADRIWRLPVVGERLRLLELATLYRTLGLLLQAGVPVIAALTSSRELVGRSLQQALDQATLAVSQGTRLSDSFERHELSTPVSLRMIRVGEHTGELGPMLERAASFYDEELAQFTEWVGRVLSPVLMLIMGVLIGGIVVLMYLPIFQVAEQIQ